jgi:hypothetical protein
MWDTTLKVLRDPLFAVGLSILLAILASRVGSCLVRLMLGIGAVAAFVWLLVRFEPFENVVVSFVSVLGTVLVVLLICLALIAVAGILAVHSMHRHEVRREARRTEKPLPPRERTTTQGHRLNDFLEVHNRLETIVGSLFDIDDVSVAKGVGRLVSAYFSGLAPHMAEVRELRDETNALLRELAGTGEFDLHQLVRLASARTYLPSRAELEELWDDELPGYAYWALRLLCVHRQWRVVATVFVKCQYGVVLTGDAI